MHHKRAQSLQVTAEMALAVVLVIGAALLIRSFLVIRNVNPGFNPHNVLTIRMLLAGPQFANTDRATQLIRERVRRIRAIPGVEAAATSCCVPLETPWQTQIVGRPEGPTSRGVAVWTPASSSRYFDLLQIPVLRGRGLTESDESGPPVAIINETLAKQFWPNSDPLNQRIIIGYESPPRQIIGIVGDLHETGLDRISRPNIYEPLIAGREIAWIIRTHGAPQLVRSAIQNELTRASGGLPVGKVRTMRDLLSRSMAAETFRSLALTIFACSALFLAAIGVYGLMAHVVSDRVHEVGIRLALGAQSADIRNMVIL